MKINQKKPKIFYLNTILLHKIYKYYMKNRTQENFTPSPKLTSAPSDLCTQKGHTFIRNKLEEKSIISNKEEFQKLLVRPDQQKHVCQKFLKSLSDRRFA